MSDAIERARRLVDAAAPGSWKVWEQGGRCGGDTLDEWSECGVDLGDGEPPILIGDNETALDFAEFIAAAPDLVRDLLALAADHEAEVERLRAALREVAQNACVWDRDAITAAIGEPASTRRTVRPSAKILRAFAELPISTQALAHAAATVRARLGEGWGLTVDFDEDRDGTEIQAERAVWPYAISLDRLPDDRWTVSVRRPNRGSYCWVNPSPSRGFASLDDAITAALAVLGETE